MTSATELVGVSQVFPAHHCHFLLIIFIRQAAFKIGSLEAVASLFKDSNQFHIKYFDLAFQSNINFTFKDFQGFINELKLVTSVT